MVVESKDRLRAISLGRDKRERVDVGKRLIGETAQKLLGAAAVVFVTVYYAEMPRGAGCIEVVEPAHGSRNTNVVSKERIALTNYGLRRRPSRRRGKAVVKCGGFFVQVVVNVEQRNERARVDEEATFYAVA